MHAYVYVYLRISMQLRICANNLRQNCAYSQHAYSINLKYEGAFLKHIFKDLKIGMRVQAVYLCKNMRILGKSLFSHYYSPSINISNRVCFH